jgi:hypothetical protein
MGRAEKPKTLEKLGVNAELLFRPEIERVTSKAESIANDERIPNSIYKKFLVETPKYVLSRMLTELPNP